MKNLIMVHLESISWQRIHALASAFPNLRRFFTEARVYNNCIASATSTRMVLTHLFYSNDFEYDLSTAFDSGRPIANNPDIFSLMRKWGYRTDILCLHALAPGGIHLAPLSSISPHVWATADFDELFKRFDDLTDNPAFAIHVWNLISHIEHSQTLASSAHGLTDQISRACSLADHALGVFLSVLERKGLLQNTTVVVYGDHGDDFWTHGFKGGMTHGTEPYTDMVHVPLAIRDVDLARGADNRLASTIDIAPTCLELLAIEESLPFHHSGRTLLASEREFVFAQNFFVSQPNHKSWGIRKACSVTDRTYTLLVSSAGLECYAHRLDPGNHCNLLNFYDFGLNSQLVYRAIHSAGSHFASALRDNPSSLESFSNAFERLRSALRVRIGQTHDFIIERGADPALALDLGCCDLINRDGRGAFLASSQVMAT